MTLGDVCSINMTSIHFLVKAAVNLVPNLQLTLAHELSVQDLALSLGLLIRH